jgi:hypothetical protein
VSHPDYDIRTLQRDKAVACDCCMEEAIHGRCFREGIDYRIEEERLTLLRGEGEWICDEC